MGVDNVSFDKEAFGRDGVVVVRDYFSPEVPRKNFDDYYARGHAIGFNQVEVNVDDEASQKFTGLQYHCGALANYALGCQWSVYNLRFVVKDALRSGPVFLHQDSPYHLGSSPKVSVFVALSTVTPENGGLEFWLGTHRYGYLGDAGEIDPSILKVKPKVICPVLGAGDVVVMNSHLWHASGPFVHGPDRVLADIIYQPYDDPARDLPREGIFRRSRVSRLRELQAEVDKLKGKK